MEIYGKEGLFGPGLEQQMFIEGSRKCGLRAMYAPGISVVYAVYNAISAALQTAQLDRPSSNRGPRNGE
jgi:hypothetical protein